MGLSNKRPRTLNYGVNKKGAKSGSKIEKAISHFLTLKKREGIEGTTKWISNAYKIINVKLKKYGINPNNI
ncbi:MAG: hypothetical protein PHR68_00900 [Candidatus Gracilibacteria bacterium]|nr:hypothetical protein [Candidatus Gracilibacteria bacterium]